jgi:predicted RNA-binding protein YlxR (DUF448 family)
MTQIKKIPTRRCTSCGEHFPKNELFRVVRSPEGEITLDKSGKASGRGAYICKSAACFKKARKSGRIATALECAIPDWVYEKIEEELEVGN